MSKPVSLAVVVTSSGDDDDDAVRRTVQAVHGLAHPGLTGIFVVGVEPAGPDDESVTVLPGAQVTSAQLGHPDHIAFLRAGDEPLPAAFATLNRERRRGLSTGLSALMPRSEDYTLTTTLGSRPYVAVDRDATVTWVGSAGYVMRSAVLDRCHVYDLHSAVGPQMLFLEAALIAGRFRPVTDAVEPGSALEDALTVEGYLYDPRWYTDLNTAFAALFADAVDRLGGVPSWLQHAYVYLLQWRMVYNRDAADKSILRNGDLTRFTDAMAHLLADVSDDVLLEPSRAVKLDLRTRLYLLGVNGADQRMTYRTYTDDITLTLGAEPVLTATACRLQIEVMDIVDDELQLSARFTFPMDHTRMTLAATYAGRQYPGKITQRYADARVFGEVVYRSETVDFAIPLKRDQNHELHFFLESTDPAARVHLNPMFRRAPSRLTVSPGAYWASGAYLVRYVNQGLLIGVGGTRATVRAELSYARHLLARPSPGRVKVELMRALYLLTRPWFARRPIWIYYDKIYKAGDNGEYAYRHAITRRDGVRKYYFLRDDVPDAERFTREGVPFVAFGSLRHKLLFLNADIVFTTHIGPPSFGGFVGPAEQLYRGLYSYRVICLQHGLTVQSLADSLNRVYDNITRYCLASPVELANVSQPAYDYRSEQLVLTGLARYDGLVSRDRRQILIAPTWRNYLAGPTKMGHSRDYSQAFADSPYCTLYNALINDERLLAAARRHGYRITLLLHPVTSSQHEDFHGNDVVEVLASAGDVSYEQILTESSLMITDYSGVQFDFAYMSKPIVYFHPPQLPPAYDEGTYHYDTMALGEVCTDVDGVVAAVSAAMARDCVIEDEYARRIKEFFAFHDRDNSARIYDVGAQLQAEITAGEAPR